LFGGGVRIGRDRVQTKRAEWRILAIDHDAHVPTRSSDAVVDIANAVIQVAGRRVRPREIAGMRDAGLLSFTGQSVCEPVRLACGVAKDLSKTETFEPPRGPRAQVSLIIVAIDDNRIIAV
jgi:hypothetical protein